MFFMDIMAEVIFNELRNLKNGTRKIFTKTCSNNLWNERNKLLARSSKESSNLASLQHVMELGTRKSP
jgi:hypothetical protein